MVASGPRLAPGSRLFPALGLLIGLGAAACNSDGASNGDGPDFAHCGVNVAHAEHACWHATFGPFVDLTPNTNSGAPVELPRPHHVYRLPAAPDGTGHVTFQADRAGLWGLFADSVDTLNVHTPQGGTKLFILRETHTRCAAFSVVFIFRLDQGAHAILTLRAPAGRTTFTLLPERLGSDWDQVLAPQPCDPSAGSPDPGSTLNDGGVAIDSATWDAEPDTGSLRESDTAAQPTADSGNPAAGETAPMCRTSGPCTRNEECCDFCHDQDHCH